MALEPIMVELKASISEFSAKMGEARSELSKLEAHHAGVSAKMAVGFAAAAGAVGIVGGVVASAVKDYGEFEQAHVKLETAVKNTGKSFDAYSKQVDALDSNFHKFGYTKEQTEDALASLTTAVQDPAKAMNLMGLAADVAKFKNIGLADAAVVVAKASEGNLRALKQMGIDLPITASNAEKVKVAQDGLAKSQENLTKIQDGTAKSADSHRRAVLGQEQATVALQSAEKAIVDARKKGASPQELTVLQERLTIAQQRMTQATDAANAPTTSLAAAQDKVRAAQAKLNDEMGAGQQVTDALSRMVGGQATAAAGTFDGRLKDASASFHDLKVELGKKVEPILTNVLDYFVNTVIPNGQTALSALQTSWDNLTNHFWSTNLGDFLVKNGWKGAIERAGKDLEGLKGDWDTFWAHISSSKTQSGAPAQHNDPTSPADWAHTLWGGLTGDPATVDRFKSGASAIDNWFSQHTNVNNPRFGAGPDMAPTPNPPNRGTTGNVINQQITITAPTASPDEIGQAIAWHTQGLNVA